MPDDKFYSNLLKEIETDEQVISSYEQKRRHPIDPFRHFDLKARRETKQTMAFLPPELREQRLPTPEREFGGLPSPVPMRGAELGELATESWKRDKIDLGEGLYLGRKDNLIYLEGHPFAVAKFKPETDEVEETAYSKTIAGLGKFIETALTPVRAMGMGLRALHKKTPEEWVGLREQYKKLIKQRDEELARVRTNEERKAITEKYIPLLREVSPATSEAEKEKFYALPWYQQLAYESPFWVATVALPSATAVRAGLGGMKGVVPEVGRVALAPLAGFEWTAGQLLKYGIGIPLKYTTRGLTQASIEAYNRTLAQSIERWIAVQGRLPPDVRGRLANWLIADRNWLIEKATNNMLRRQTEKKGQKYAVRTAADDTIKDIEVKLLEEHPAVPGQTRSVSDILRTLEAKPPAMAGARAELVPKKPPVPKAVPEVTPAVEIPKAAPGMPEAGIQPSMIEEVAGKEVFPRGKGEVTQIKMEDYAKLQEAKARELEAKLAEIAPTEDEIMQMEMELAGTAEWIETEPAKKLTDLVKKVGWHKGEISNLTLKQYRDVTGKAEILPNILTPDKKHVRWEYALDDVATEMGYESGDALREAIQSIVKAKEGVRALRTKLTVAAKEEEKPISLVKGFEQKPKLTDELQSQYQRFTEDLEAWKVTLKGLKGEEATTARQTIKLLEKEIVNTQKTLAGIKAVSDDVKGLRQKIMAIAGFKGLPKTQLSALYKKLTGKSGLRQMTESQLKDVLEAVRIARPKTIKGKRVIKASTERRIASLKENLIEKGKIYEECYEATKKYLRLPTDKYESANLFITESEGKELIRQLNFEAEVGLLAHDKSVMDALADKPALSGVIDDVSKAVEFELRTGEATVHSKVLLDMRYYTQRLQAQTGGRFYDVWTRANNKRLENRVKAQEITVEIEQSTAAYENIAGNEEALQRVTQYIASKHKMGPDKPKVIHAEEIKLADAISKALFKFEPDVRYWRFHTAYYQHGGDIYRMQADIPNAPAGDLRQAIRVYESEGAEGLYKFLKDKDWGVIKTGYEPHIAINPHLQIRRVSAAVLGKGHLKTREAISFDAEEKNIIQRTRSYVHQMLNLEMEPYIRAMDKVYGENIDKFANPGKVKTELSLAMQEMKGYLFLTEPLARGIMKGAAFAYTAIFFQPHLSFRNLFQNLAMHPDREAFLNPLNRRLSDAEMKYFNTYINQHLNIKREWLMQEAIGFGRLARLAKKVTYYGYSDQVNRIGSFWASINKAERALKRFRKDGNVSNFIKSAGVIDLTPIQQKQALELLALNETDAVRFIAREITNNVHFVYDRAQRAPIEMGVAGRTIGTLMTFSRSWGQRMALQLQRLRGDKAFKAAARKRALKIVLGNILLGIMAGELYRKATGKKVNPYNPIHILSWTPGGFAVNVLADLGEGMWTIAWAAQGDEYAISKLPQVLTRMGDTFILFYAPTINVLEALTNTRYVDREAIRRVKEIFDKEYERNKEFYEKERQWWGKLQHALFGGEEPEPSDLEAALADVDEALNQLGKPDEEAIAESLAEAETELERLDILRGAKPYDIGNLASEIRRATNKLDLDLISEEHGFPPIVLAWVEADALFTAYYDLPEDKRDDLLEKEPLLKPYLYFWGRWKAKIDPATEAAVRRMARRYKIPENVIPVLQQELRKPEITPKTEERPITPFPTPRRQEELAIGGGSIKRF